MSATDLDSGANGQITYSIPADVTAFVIDSNSGKIYVNSALDREIVAFYEFEVTATDGGNYHICRG